MGFLRYEMERRGALGVLIHWRFRPQRASKQPLADASAARSPVWPARCRIGSVICYGMCMALPSDLLQAVSSSGGGKLSLVVGAGCSVESPTNIPVASLCSLEVHRRLVADGVLANGECSHPEDLSAVADAVFAKTGSQRGVVERLLDAYQLKLATANEGYRIAAALMFEGAVVSLVTLNFDLAISHALSELGAGTTVGVVECPGDLARQRKINIYYLHRSANETDPEAWVLRTVTLESEWRSNWQPIIATKVLAVPVVVFAGLGSPAAVLLESTNLIRRSLSGIKVFQVDPGAMASSRFSVALGVTPGEYVQIGWCEFMEQLGARLLAEQLVKLQAAVERKIRGDKLPAEDISELRQRLEVLGLVKVGRLRARWLLYDRPYCPEQAESADLMGDLLLGLAMTGRVSGAKVVIVEDALVEFVRDERVVAAYLVASGCGHRSKVAMEAALERECSSYRGRVSAISGAIIAGTSDLGAQSPTPPKDVVRGDMSEDIVLDMSDFPLIHVDELRVDSARISQIVP